MTFVAAGRFSPRIIVFLCVNTLLLTTFTLIRKPVHRPWTSTSQTLIPQENDLDPWTNPPSQSLSSFPQENYEHDDPPSLSLTNQHIASQHDSFTPEAPSETASETSSEAPSGTPSHENKPPWQDFDRRCSVSPDPGDIVVVVKTGATEVFEKLPTHLMTVLNCAKDILIFSNMEHNIGPYHIYDSLANLPDSTKADEKFELYRKIQEYQEAGQDVRELHTAGHSGWTLDKYKFLPMVEQTFQKRPDKEWYIFVETDTYLLWNNVLQWLERLDSSKPLYLGSVAFLGSNPFAHGGSGFILSRPAMERFVGRDRSEVKMHEEEEELRHSCCGDSVLANVLREAGVEVSQRHPMINGETPVGMPFGPSHWCQPLMTMHHMKSQEISDMWQYEQERADPSKLFLLKDLFDYSLKPFLTETLDDWHNRADDFQFYPPTYDGERHKEPNSEHMTELQRVAWRSFEDCGKACEEHVECFQYVFEGDKCGLGRSFRLGEKRERDSDRSFKSGWNLERINHFRTEHECEGPQWVD
ncbi:MAG: hypothetical protein M1833_007129 [Piccolia ochrophora]|nr:MAG: hypothetical protein M1833_007129 [Piccolia ochrophora]